MAQLIMFAAAPALSRLYEPAVFGQYASLSLLLSIITVMATGKYELGILLPESKTEAWALATLAGGMALVTAVLIGLGAALWLFLTRPVSWLGQIGVAQYGLLLLAMGMIVASAWQTILFSWMNRLGLYNSISTSRLTQAGTATVAQMTLSLISDSMLSLLLGTVLGLAVCLMLQWTSVRREIHLPWPDKGVIGKVARSHLNLPKYSIPTDLIGTLLAQLPILLLGLKFTDATVGMFSLAQRTLQAPMQLVSNSVGEVFRTQAAQLYAAEGHCDQYFRDTIRLLTPFAGAAVAVVVFAGPDIFALIFGKAWYTAGEYARILIILFSLKFVVSPVSYMFIIARKTSLDFRLHLLFLVVLGFIYFASWPWLESPIEVLAIFVFVLSPMYLVYLKLSSRFAAGRV